MILEENKIWFVKFQVTEVSHFVRKNFYSEEKAKEYSEKVKQSFKFLGFWSFGIEPDVEWELVEE